MTASPVSSITSANPSKIRPFQAFDGDDRTVI